MGDQVTVMSYATISFLVTRVRREVFSFGILLFFKVLP